MRTQILASVLLAVTSAVGCGGHAAPGEGGDSSQADQTVASHPSGPAVSDAQLAAELKTPPPKLPVSEQKKLISDTIEPTATTPRLRMLNDFIAAGIKQVDPKSDDVPYNSFAGVMQALFWGTPRDLVATPSGAGGQTFTEAFAVDDSGGGPTKLTVAGKASADYELAFTIAGAAVKAKIAKGSTPEATAKAIGAALQAASKSIEKSIGDEKTFGPIGGNHMDTLMGIDDVEVDASGATVTITVAING